MDIFPQQVRYLRLVGRPWPRLLNLTRYSPEALYDARCTRVTCHAGEDFVHILTGLRHVDEAVEYYALQRGDRIGHGLSVGVDPVKWMQRLGRRCVLFQGEWLDDLVWFHHSKGMVQHHRAGA
jgi:hypothetical protein